MRDCFGQTHEKSPEPAVLSCHSVERDLVYVLHPLVPVVTFSNDPQRETMFRGKGIAVDPVCKEDPFRHGIVKRHAEGLFIIASGASERYVGDARFCVSPTHDLFDGDPFPEPVVCEKTGAST